MCLYLTNRLHVRYCSNLSYSSETITGPGVCLYFTTCPTCQVLFKPVTLLRDHNRPWGVSLFYYLPYMSDTVQTCHNPQTLNKPWGVALFYYLSYTSGTVQTCHNPQTLNRPWGVSLFYYLSYTSGTVGTCHAP